MKYVLHLSGNSNRVIEFKTKRKKNGEQRLKVGYRNQGTETFTEQSEPILTWQVNFGGKNYAGKIHNP
jgi:hypothetical protein